MSKSTITRLFIGSGIAIVAGAILADGHVIKADGAEGEERYRSRAAHDRLKPGDGANFRLHRLACGFRRDKKRCDREQSGADDEHRRKS